MSCIARYILPVGALVIVLGQAVAIASPTARGLVSINRSSVELKDLFTEAGPQADAVLGPAPIPGNRIEVGSAQLEAIARQYGVAWKSDASGESVIIERPGIPIDRSAITQALRPALLGAGAPRHAMIQIAEGDLPMVPPGGQPHVVINRINYDRLDGRFSASALLGAPNMRARVVSFTGLAVPARRVVVANHTLLPGEILGGADVTLQWVARASVPKGALTDPSNAIGMQVDRRVAAGTPLADRAVTRPMLINRGATVSLTVDMPGIEVTAQGVALAAGGEGAVIPVLNPSSHEVVQAVIDGRDHAHVLPGSQPSQSNSKASYYAMIGRQK